MAPKFPQWVNLPSALDWLDIGCGTGALSSAIWQTCRPSQLTSVDPSEGFLVKAKTKLQGKGRFLLGSAAELPLNDDACDVVVSGLALNFFPDLEKALAEMRATDSQMELVG